MKQLQSVDERTRLAGTNRLEILLFSLGKDQKTGREEVFGINVFKVREVLNVPEITHAPDVPPGVVGMVSLRGSMIPVIDLAYFCEVEVNEPPKILIVSEYNRNTLGFLVHSVEHILRMDWNQIKVPPSMMNHRMGGLVTAVSELEDGRIIMILDVEKILSDTAVSEEEEKMLYQDVTNAGEVKTILFADDSSVARKQISKTIEKMGFKYICANNGMDAWSKLEDIKSRAKENNVPVTHYIQAVLTDIEMPEMDGYVLTKKIKGDSMLSVLPVIMHSSLSADANVNLGKSVGADHYVAKFSPAELSRALRDISD